MSFTTRRRYNRFKGAPKIATRFQPVVWVEGPAVWATCIQLSAANQEFTQDQETRWLPVLARELRKTYGVNAETLTLTFDRENWRYRVNFNNDEEFIMLKMMHM